MEKIFETLRAPFSPEKVSWRVGQINKNDATRASSLCYIDARDVMERLDSIIGPSKWRDRYEETAKGRILCTIEIRIEGEWVGKSDAAGDTAVEAEKGAVSDAFKRAAVKWGVGRYLYDIPVQWVEINPKTKRILPKEHDRLTKVLPGSRVPDCDSPDVQESQPPQPVKQQPKPQQPPRQQEATPFDDPPPVRKIDVPHNGNMSDWGAYSGDMVAAIEAVTSISELDALLKVNDPALQNCKNEKKESAAIIGRTITKRRNDLSKRAA